MKRAANLAATVAATAVLALSLAFVATGLVVRRGVLDDATYRSALADAEAYDRLYTEVLTDPALSVAVADLLGRLEVDPALAPDVTATTTNALRWALPPDRVQLVVDAVLTDVTAYLRADTDELAPTVELADILDRVDEAAVTLTRTLLSHAKTVESTTLADFRTHLRSFADQLEAGRVPAAVPVLVGPEATPDNVVDAVAESAGVELSRADRMRIVAAVAGGDERDAVAEVSAGLVGPYVEAEVAKLQARTDDGRFDLVAQITDRARQRSGSAEVNLAGARRAARIVGPIPLTIATLIAGLSVIGLVVLRRSRAPLPVAIGAAVATTAVFFIGWLVTAQLAAPLDAATGTGKGSWNLPDGVRSVVGDVAGRIGDSIRNDLERAGVILLLLAAAAGLVALAPKIAATARAATERRGRVALPVAAALSCLTLVVGAGVVTSSTVSASAADACNGHAELCSRRYDEVAFAATHNSMSSPDVVQVWPEQDGNMTAQLDAGIRALLIDTHYWRRVDSIADLVDAADPTSTPLSEPVAQAVLDAAGDLAQARPGTFLCHNECVFGGQSFVQALTELRQWLEENPREVVTLIIQDAVSPADTAKAFTDAGLDDLVYDQADRWPTLGELIERDRRLVVFAERQGGTPAWYAPAFEAMQETPYEFRDIGEFSCAPGRGPADAPLLLVNHWISRLTPSRADAAIANAPDVLLDRVETCREERGQIPNFVAVDFYNLGDVVGVVDRLNGFDRPRS